MSISNISPLIAGGTTAADRRALGKDEFLTLLVTQLKHQDPLSPLQAHEFAAQLAQFTSVEKLTELNEGMARQEESLAMATLLSKTSFSAGLIGRQVMAAGDQVTVANGDGPTRVTIDVGTGGGQGKLQILDSTGREVATRELGPLHAGRQTVALPADLPPGTYRYKVTVTGAGDKKVPVTTFTTGVVDGISFLSGRIVLRMGTIEIELEDVAEIEPAHTAAPPAEPAPGIAKEPELPRMPPIPVGGDLARWFPLGIG